MNADNATQTVYAYTDIAQAGTVTFLEKYESMLLERHAEGDYGPHLGRLAQLPQLAPIRRRSNFQLTDPAVTAPRGVLYRACMTAWTASFVC